MIIVCWVGLLQTFKKKHNIINEKIANEFFDVQNKLMNFYDVPTFREIKLAVLSLVLGWQ